MPPMVSPEVDAFASLIGYAVTTWAVWQFGIKNLLGLNKEKVDWQKRYRQLQLSLEERNAREAP